MTEAFFPYMSQQTLLKPNNLFEENCFDINTVMSPLIENTKMF